MKWFPPQVALTKLGASKDTLRSLIKNGAVPCQFLVTRVLVGIDYEKLLPIVIRKAERLRAVHARMKAREAELISREERIQQLAAEIAEREHDLRQYEADLVAASERLNHTRESVRRDIDRDKSSQTIVETKFRGRAAALTIREDSTGRRTQETDNAQKGIEVAGSELAESHSPLHAKNAKHQEELADLVELLVTFGESSKDITQPVGWAKQMINRILGFWHSPTA